MMTTDNEIKRLNAKAGLNPGETCTISGIYELFDLYDNGETTSAGLKATCVEGEPMPPSLEPAQVWQLQIETQESYCELAKTLNKWYGKEIDVFAGWDSDKSYRTERRKVIGIVDGINGIELIVPDGEDTTTVLLSEIEANLPSE